MAKKVSKQKGALVKVQKNKAYFKRFQVKYRRRREGKTDYSRRKKLVIQAKNKYETHKYRLVVRKSNREIVCQVVYSTLAGDKVLASAYSLDLKRYGLKAGFTNYAAAYCTGLLCGRRALSKVGLSDTYTGVGNDEEDEVTGEIVKTTEGKRTFFVDELNEDKRPFKVLFDVGLSRTSLGAKVFGALKGAVDAGLDIPHSYKKFPGYDPEEKTYDAAAHKDAIFGSSVSGYMEFLAQEDEESGTKKLSQQFKTYVDNGITADDVEEMYKEVHKKIREDPSPKYDKTHKERVEAGDVKFDKTFKHKAKISSEDRMAKVEEKRKKIVEMEGNEPEEMDLDQDGDEEEDEE